MWIEAVTMLVKRPKEKSNYPKCKNRTSKPKDEPFGGGKIDRYFIFDFLGLLGVVTINKPN